jgi:type IX secretion system PorP/SprF family membrane protein
MKTKTIATIIIGLFSLGAYAQQDAGFSMYFFNPVYVNPAYAGSREVISGSLVHRSQWVNLSGAPTTQFLSIHSAIPNSNVGLGVQVYNDKAGPMKNTGIQATFAYHIPMGERAKLAFGLTGMVNNIRIDGSDLVIDDNTDPAFSSGTSSSWVPDAAGGVYFYMPRFYAGFSATHLMESKFSLSDVPTADHAKFFRHYYLTSGVVLPVSSNVDFRPSILLKYVNAAPLLGEIDASFIFYQKLFVGAGFRTGKKIDISGMDNMLIGIVQYQIARFIGIGYAYDYYLNRTGAFNSGTHEFMLSWDIGGTKTRMSSPRYF